MVSYEKMLSMIAQVIENLTNQPKNYFTTNIFELRLIILNSTKLRMQVANKLQVKPEYIKKFASIQITQRIFKISPKLYGQIQRQFWRVKDKSNSQKEIFVSNYLNKNSYKGQTYPVYFSKVVLKKLQNPGMQIDIIQNFEECSSDYKGEFTEVSLGKNLFNELTDEDKRLSLVQIDNLSRIDKGGHIILL